MASRGLITETATATAGVLAAEELKELTKKFFESEVGRKITGKIGEHIGHMFDPDDNRIDMINFIYGPLKVRMNGIPTANIALYLTNAMKDPLGDNPVVQALCLVFKNTRAKDPNDPEKYKFPNPKHDKYLLDVFEELGLLSETEFRERLEHYVHDPAKQLWKYVVNKTKSGVNTAANWAFGFIVLTVAWFYLILRASVSNASQVDMWILALAPIPVIILLATFKRFTLIVFPLAHWVSERYRIGLTRFVGKVFATGLVMAFLLSIWPMPSGKMALMLAVGVTGILFAKLAKMFTVSIVSLLIIGYVAYGAFKAEDVSKPQVIKATAESAIAKAVNIIGFGPGSSESNPIVLSNDPKADPIVMETGTTLWFKIEPGGWTQSIARLDKSKFEVVFLSSDIEEQRYVEERGRGGLWLPSFIDGPHKRPNYPPFSTAMRFKSTKTVLAQIRVKPASNQ